MCASYMVIQPMSRIIKLRKERACMIGQRLRQETRVAENIFGCMQEVQPGK